MKEFTEKRHADYTMWVRTFPQTEKDYKASPQQQYGAHTHAGGALGGELKDKSEKSEEDNEDDDEEDNEDDDEEDNVNAICLFCREKGKKDKHWKSKCRLIDSNSKGELTNLSFCVLCLYRKKANNEHFCKTFFNRNKLFCKRCSVHVKLCRRPKSHEAVVLTEGAQLAEQNEEQNEEDHEDESDESDESDKPDEEGKE